MRTFGQRSCRAAGRRQAFTLIEVVVASAILAVGLGGILMICSNGLRTARVLDRVHVDAGSLAAYLSLTNRLEEGVDSGTFGDVYPGYRWSREIREAEGYTNGLYRVDFVVFDSGDPRGTESRLTLFLYRPQSVRGVGP
ncbi:MAG: prepilin-type N-terminal cleavage/methylation domain-containing protein [Verrucomicrobiae bacterium]|nr:prepilin-type N-terminal cleavage/methylation domain-containing protein [Verrucomicrobiae bacterium]